jgi:hypothetical protein
LKVFLTFDKDRLKKPKRLSNEKLRNKKAAVAYFAEATTKAKPATVRRQGAGESFDKLRIKMVNLSKKEKS